MNNNNNFNIDFKWIGVGTWVLTIDDLKIGCDPLLCPKGTVMNFGFGRKSKRITDPKFTNSDFTDIDMWFITHEHNDHIDSKGLEVIDSDTIIISNKKAIKTLKQISPKKLTAISWHQTISYKVKDYDITIKAVPAVHASNFIGSIILGGGNGYWLTIKKNNVTLDIYITGDTINHKKVINAISNKKADIIIPNMGAVERDSFIGPVTFSAELLKDVVERIQPDLIFPVHADSLTHFKEPMSELEKWNDDRVKILKEGEHYIQEK